MLVYLNGLFVEEKDALLSVLDRGFLYGDGLFETLRISNGRPFLWAAHLERLQRGAAFLGIPIPHGSELKVAAERLIATNGLPECLIRINVSRGAGEPGYAPKGASNPTLVMTVRPLPEPVAHWSLVTSTLRVLADDPFSQFKTCNKLPQILARAEAEKAAGDEALLLNDEGSVVEGSSSNIFWVKDDMVFTIPLAAGALPGVTRALVMELALRLGVGIVERCISPMELRSADGVFLTLSSLGIVEAVSIDGATFARSPVTARLIKAYKACLGADL
ncbi:MAG TPA: aminodeoxychorismate lyase [Candidatus Dormibacteraeota bacterium]|nr:aminodeoxychorismate lyase [Candidatus Dormibacteraeota bacterium]